MALQVGRPQADTALSNTSAPGFLDDGRRGDDVDIDEEGRSVAVRTRDEPDMEEPAEPDPTAEEVHVLRDATTSTIRLISFPTLFTFPVAATFAILFAEQAARDRLVPWIVATAVAAAVGAGALVNARRLHRAGRSRRSRSMLCVTAAAVGSIWGSATFLIDFDTLGASTVLLFFPLGASMLSIIVCSRCTSVFLAGQIAITATALAGLLTDVRGESIAIMAASVAWFFASLLLHRLVHDDSEEAVRLRFRTEQLVAELSAERRHLGELNDRLHHQATHDHLTELANRRGSLDALDVALGARADDEVVGLVYLDLDHFKQINDLHGHEAGDTFLQSTAQRLRRSLPEGSTAGRLGGDELVAILPRLSRPEEAHELAQLLASTLQQPVHVHGREVTTTVSIGVAVAPAHATSTGGLIRYANAALHRAKANGRARIELFDSRLQTSIDTRAHAEAELRRALDHGEIVPFLQPELDAATSRVIGAEVLARWLRRDGTVLNAVAFIATARELGMLDQLQHSVIGHVGPVIKRLHALGLPEGFRFRINMTSLVRDRVWTRDVIDQMFHGIDPHLLTVDVTEDLVTGHPTEAASALAALRSAGIRVGLDDFGRGGSSITLLRKLPLDEVRIDHGVLENVTSSAADRAVVRAIVMLVHDLGLSITADGVETPTQADALLALGCKRQQGHLYAPALPPAAFERFVLDREMAFSQPREDNWSTDELS